MELDDALGQIAAIRRQVDRATLFRGYRAAPVALSGVLALAAGAVQPWWVPTPTHDPVAYLALWIGVAALSVAAVGVEMSLRLITSPLLRDKALLAVGQFAPCLAAGALVTLVLFRRAPDSLWMLPGLWQVLFALGVFASASILPRAVLAVGAFYLTAGLFCLGSAQGDAAFAPWAMAVPFGAGQFLTAGVLSYHLERADEPRDA